MSLIKNKRELAGSLSIFGCMACFLLMVSFLFPSWQSDILISVLVNLIIYSLLAFGLSALWSAFSYPPSEVSDKKCEEPLHHHYLIQHNAESSTEIEVRIRWPSRPCGVNESHGVIVTCKKCSVASPLSS